MRVTNIHFASSKKCNNDNDDNISRRNNNKTYLSVESRPGLDLLLSL